MKPYADAGFASLGEVSGHRAETLTSLLNASNFQRTHEFLLQACEAFYRYFLFLYVAHISDSRAQESESSINQDITALVSGLAAQLNSNCG